MGLVGLDVDNEDKGVVLLDLLHGRLSVEWVNDDLVLIKTRLAGDRLSDDLGSTGQLKGLGAVEGSRQTDFADLVGVDLRIISVHDYG